MTSCIVTIPNHLKTQEMCDEAVDINPRSLAYVPNHFKTQKMCNEAVRNKLCMLLFDPDRLRTQEMCNEIMRTMSDAFHRILDRFTTRAICYQAVKEDSSSLQFVPDWFVTREWILMWYDDYYDDDGDHWDNDDDEEKLFEWYDGYKKRKVQKQRLRKNSCLLLGIHQDVGIGVCQNMKKKRQKNYGHKHETFLYLMTGYKKFLTKREIKKKMSLSVHGEDDIIIIVRKHTTPANDNHNLPYYIARIQRRKRYVKLRWFDQRFPDHEVIVEIDNPNSIHAFNRFEGEEHAERKDNHFRLIDLTREELYAMGVPGILDDEDEEE